MFRRETKALVGRCFKRIGEILSGSEAMDLREEIAIKKISKIGNSKITFLTNVSFGHKHFDTL